MTCPIKPGPCCACGVQADSVLNLLCMDFEAPAGFCGWGCLQCGVPGRGAIAIVCDVCLASNAEPLFILGGRYAAEGVRIPLDGFERKPFGHNMAKHPECS